MSELVKISIENGVADARLNKPEKYNALDYDMFKAIVEAGESIGTNKSVRAVVLSGEGSGFCSGLDFSSFKEMQSEGKERLFSLFERKKDNPANLVQRCAYVWKQLSVPVIAAVKGVAFGGGFQIALGADIRFASPDARFSVMEIKWGLVPDMSATQTLCDLVRLDVAKELIFTGKIVGAEEAQGLGLVTRVCDDPLAEAHDLAREIVGKSPHAIAAGKRLLEEAWRAGAGKGLRLEEKLQQSLLNSPNQIESVLANLEKREPKFRDIE